MARRAYAVSIVYSVPREMDPTEAWESLIEKAPLPDHLSHRLEFASGPHDIEYMDDPDYDVVPSAPFLPGGQYHVLPRTEES